MPFFRKKPIPVQVDQWHRNGDHPNDESQFIKVSGGSGFLSEGKVVRNFRRPDGATNEPCKQCGGDMAVHGWIDTLEGGHIVCPGDWVVTGVKGERYPIKDLIFRETYEPADAPDAVAVV